MRADKLARMGGLCVGCQTAEAVAHLGLADWIAAAAEGREAGPPPVPFTVTRMPAAGRRAWVARQVDAVMRRRSAAPGIMLTAVAGRQIGEK
jgi:hypothetical protein